MNCLRLIAFLAAICWSAVAAADTLTTNLTTYSTGDAITIVFTTTSLYETVAIDVNGIIVKTLTDTVNLITGTITYTGFVTCPMGPSGAVTSLAINATTTLPSGSPAITATTAVGYTYVAANCLAYFTTPSSNPATIPAAQQYLASIATTTVTFTDAYITLNGQFFCSLGAVLANDTASCAGFVPCFLPCSAQFAIVGKEFGAAYVTYPGPTVQLTPNASCNPLFSSEPGTGDSCPAPYTPLTTITFDFTISANDNIATYSNFEIYATNPLLATPVFVAKVPGPLCVISEAPSTFIITKWLIPCEFNNLGATTFTLTYTQTLSGTEKILASQTLSFTIGENIDCNLTLVVNTLGDCPLPYTPSDCQCLASSSGKGCSVVPCGNCPSCPSLSIAPNSTFEPGDVLNFYVHNGAIGLTGGDSSTSIISDTQYFTNTATAYTAGVSAINFYANIFGVGIFGYKPVGTLGNTLTAIPVGIANLRGISAWTNAGTDVIWAIDSVTTSLYCGSTAGMASVALTPMPAASLYNPVAVGPLGVWMIDATTHTLHWKASQSCSDPTNFLPVVLSPSSLKNVTSGLNEVWITNGTTIWYLTSPAGSPVGAPAGGPTANFGIYGSNIDDSLIALATTPVGAIWYLPSPTGTWTNLTTTPFYYEAANYGNNIFFVQEALSGSFPTHEMLLSTWKYFPVATYADLSLVITSTLPPLTLYDSTTPPTFNSCNNDLIVSWTIPSNYKSIGPVTATLTYNVLYPTMLVAQLTSSATFTIGPTPVDSLKPRDFCPSATSSSTSSVSLKLRSGCGCK